MPGKWRLQVRKARHALKAGRLEEAHQLADSPLVRSFRPARELVENVADALLERAKKHLGLGDSRRAWDDLQKAAAINSGDPRLSPVREQLTQRTLGEVRDCLSHAQATAALKLLAELNRWNVSGPEVRRLREGAAAWRDGSAHTRAGRFAEALKQLRHARTLLPETSALDACVALTEAAQEKAAPLEARLHRALSEEDWSAVLLAADALLSLAPEHGPAQGARRRAWRAVGHTTQYRPPVRKMSLVSASSSSNSSVPDSTRFLLWVDGVGGYLVCMGDRVSLGQPAGSRVDVPILADLSRLQAWIQRVEDAYVLRPHGSAAVNGRPVSEAVPLADGDLIELGRSVRLRFRQPSPLSATARLELESNHRLPWAVAGVLLMADTCILGPERSSHVVTRPETPRVVLYRQGEELWCRSEADFDVDDSPASGRARVQPPARIRGEEFSLGLEPL